MRSGNSIRRSDADREIGEQRLLERKPQNLSGIINSAGRSLHGKSLKISRVFAGWDWPAALGRSFQSSSALTQDCTCFTEAETGLWKEGLCGQEPDAQGKAEAQAWSHSTASPTIYALPIYSCLPSCLDKPGNSDGERRNYLTSQISLCAQTWG